MWTQNICSVFALKVAFSNLSGIVWTRPEPLHLSVSTLVVFRVLEQKKQRHIRIGQTQSDRDLLSWFEKRFSEKKYCLLFETSLYYFSFLDCFIPAKPFAFQLLRDEVSKQSKKSGVPPMILFLLQWLSVIFFRLKRSMLNFGFSLFKHDDNFCQLLHGWIHLGRSFLRVKP